MSGAVWIIGGGSGIGRGAAHALASGPGTVVLSGRRVEELERVAAQVRDLGGSARVLPLDIADTAAVTAAAADIAEREGHVETLVFSAGTNIRNRFWDDTDADAIASVIDVNLNGAVRAVHAVLPGMREAGGGLIVLVSSWAGWRHAPGAGAAYSTSKTALGALAEGINEQQRLHGIRATHFCPGEVATEILDTRPNPPSADARELMLTAEEVGDAIAWIVRLSPRICVNEIVFTPTHNTSYD